MKSRFLAIDEVETTSRGWNTTRVSVLVICSSDSSIGSMLIDEASDPLPDLRRFGEFPFSPQAPPPVKETNAARRR
jgi:hypothetical protein